MSTAVKVILAIGIAIGGAIVLLAIFGVVIARHVHVRETGLSDQKTVHIDTPFGNVSVHENSHLDPELIGVPIYPGAKRTGDKGGADFEFDAGALHRNWTVAGATYVTDDPPDKVEDFYKQHFPAWNTTWANGDLKIEEKEGDGRFRTISVKRENGHTRIGVASAGPPASN